MRKAIAFSIFSFVVGFSAIGCTRATLTPIKGPDGQEWVAISCSHGAKNCWKAAADFCPLGYETADEVQSISHGPLPFLSHTKDEMLVRCKAPSEAASTPRQTQPATQGGPSQGQGSPPRAQGS